ncbi:reverse transcriptase domain-containing protein [Tanacetum coccineum]|uniref:Reverse transcriptase domain-containing protein n=1 Tax=Tanacetum coccineum TaxID=301880 RepID=A0ABQ5IUI7_9ASTR
MEKAMERYGVVHRFSTAYHPQINGQVENTNRAIKRILEKTIGNNMKDWSYKLDDALWAFRTTFKTPLGTVLLFNSRLRLFPGKLKSRWYGLFTISKDMKNGAIELYDEEGGEFIVNKQWVKPYQKNLLDTNKEDDVTLDDDREVTLGRVLCLGSCKTSCRSPTTTASVIPNKGDLRDYWIEISSDGDFLGPAPSYVYIRDPVRRLCHRMIACNMLRGGRVELGYLEVTSLGAMAAHFGLVSDQGLRAPGTKRQHTATAGAPGAAEDAPAADEGAQAVLAPVQAPQLPPPAPQPRTMSQRIDRLEEKDLAIRKSTIWYTLKKTCVELVRSILKPRQLICFRGRLISSILINRGLIQAIPTSLPPQQIGEATKASNLQRIAPGV